LAANNKCGEAAIRQDLFTGVLWWLMHLHILALKNAELSHWEGRAMASLHCYCKKKRDQMLFTWVFN